VFERVETNPGQGGAPLTLDKLPSQEYVQPVKIMLAAEGATGPTVNAADPMPVTGTALTAIATGVGAPADAVATTDTGAFSLLALIKRALQNWTTLLARLPALAVTATPMLNGVTSLISGSPVADTGRAPTFTGRVAGTGAVSATVAIEVRNDAAGVWVNAGTLTMSGATTAGDGFAMAARYLQYRATVTAISGAGAAVTVTMGA
jgi:hypothetical protein